MIDYNPLSSFTIPKLPPKKPTYFTPVQREMWEKYKSHSIIKQKAADLFVLIMHTGFDYGDLYEVGRQHYVFFKGQKYLVKPRHKNGQEAIIPLSEKAEEILERYDYKMKLLSNPELNAAIKEVARELGINIHLTVKTGRKIYAMHQLNNEGYTMEATSKMLGHKSVKTCEQTYAQVNIHLVHNEITGKNSPR
jgi:site-specific recombinase XerD